ncbi:MAG: DNA cytosine methyltransferase [Candidatus Didemnitutus sp.]|nr:DNA cytosine methyltransferase [Candidatus Didemnitutus sp.]
MLIPVIDLFAGPGGLNEGFNRTRDVRGRRVFGTVISVECDPFAHRTLELRALFRKLAERGDLDDYLRYTRGEITRDELMRRAGDLAQSAAEEAMQARLGDPAHDREIEARIRRALRRAGSGECVLIGGPPCQAYSLVGRARRRNDATFAEDHKHVLYREYLRIVGLFRPAVFLMENVPGLLSAKFQGAGTFDMICADLRSAGYTVHALGDGAESDDPRRFVVRADEHGVPQSRARIFLLGLRADLKLAAAPLMRPDPGVIHTVADVVSDLPAIRSRLSKGGGDSGPAWAAEIARAFTPRRIAAMEPVVAGRLAHELSGLRTDLPLGAPHMERARGGPRALREWYEDAPCGVLNHNSRGHMASDLHRYMYWAAYGAVHHRSPTLHDVPAFLLPEHANVGRDPDTMPFGDRFRVQLGKRPSTTVVSHIAKDGHYYIHPSARQCRSLSVREAARLQTFPDSYLFEGPITEQYKQVGNAVPPWLASRLGALVHGILTGRAP